MTLPETGTNRQEFARPTCFDDSIDSPPISKIPLMPLHQNPRLPEPLKMPLQPPLFCLKFRRCHCSVTILFNSQAIQNAPSFRAKPTVAYLHQLFANALSHRAELTAAPLMQPNHPLSNIPLWNAMLKYRLLSNVPLWKAPLRNRLLWHSCCSCCPTMPDLNLSAFRSLRCSSWPSFNYNYPLLIQPLWLPVNRLSN